MTQGFRQTRLWLLDIPDLPPAGWPVVIDDVSLAFNIGIPNRTLQWMLARRQAETAYIHRDIPQYHDAEKKKFKKMRRTQEPFSDVRTYKTKGVEKTYEVGLKPIHTVLNGLFSALPLPDSVTSYRPGKSLRFDIDQHVRQPVWLADTPGLPTDDVHRDLEESLKKDPRYQAVPRHKDPHDPTSPKGKIYLQPIWAVQIDISDFFNSIRASWIRKYLVDHVGYTHRVAQTFARLVTVKQGDKRYLPQGSPLSGSLANLIAHHLYGQAVLDYLKTESPDWAFTVYSDDLFLTHPSLTLSRAEVERVQRDVIRLVERGGFLINKAKSRIKNSRVERIERLGAVICEGVNIPREKYLRLKSLIHNCQKTGFVLQAGKAGKATGGLVADHIRGMLQHFKQLRPDLYLRLDGEFQKALEKWPLNAGGGGTPTSTEAQAAGLARVVDFFEIPGIEATN